MDVGPGVKELVSNLTGGAGKTERGDSLAGGSVTMALEPSCRKDSIRGKVVGLCNVVNVGGRGGVKVIITWDKFDDKVVALGLDYARVTEEDGEGKKIGGCIFFEACGRIR